MLSTGKANTGKPYPAESFGGAVHHAPYDFTQDCTRNRGCTKSLCATAPARMGRQLFSAACLLTGPELTGPSSSIKRTFGPR